MKRFNSARSKTFAFLLVALFILACESLAAPAVDPTATNPPPTTQPTKTPAPTKTPLPTATKFIDHAATQRADELSAFLKIFKGKGYITTTNGDAIELEPFKEEWAQIGWFNSWGYDVVTSSEFIFKAHFKWSTASSTPEATGCGVIFGAQDNGDYYAVFLDNHRIYFFMNRGQNLYIVGKTNGKGVTNFGNPAESDFVLAVSEKKAHVVVDGVDTLYTLSEDQTAAGTIGLSLLSGTNKDYGTRCEATDMVVWSASK